MIRLFKNIARAILHSFCITIYKGKIKKIKMSPFEIRKDRARYRELNNDSRFTINKQNDYICKYDKYATNGAIDNGYFIQDIWGARKVLQNKPTIHYDIGSSVAGFIAHLLSFHQKIVLIDIRTMTNDLNTDFIKWGGVE